MSDLHSFSARNGISDPAPAKPEEAPQAIRYWVFQYLKNEHPSSPVEAADVLANFLQHPSFSAGFSGSDHNGAWRKLQIFVRELEWWKIYDLLEYICESMKYGRKQFISMLNSDLAAEENCYRMNDHGQIVFTGTDALEGSVSRAETVLGVKGRYPAKNEIHKAMEALSKRPKPDLTAAAQHALAGLEIAARNFTGENRATLKEIVEKHPETFPAPLGQAICLLHEYAAGKVKQAAEGATFNYDELELMIGIEANLTMYLNR